ncbi:MAG: hypothetical protein A2953_02945 [Candidatus Levybacteria bacterium RIFCSPLOWO2_01_FULL_36_54]|nr:MAG: hypothetical protein A2953_02945 [Candidatus Levybacteria bacterium RIFCSPLOWO2_01_FULL_36_54]
MIIVRALVRQLHRKGVTTCPRQAAEAGFIGTLLPAPAVHRVQAHPRQLGQPQHLAGEAVAAHVHLDITGCLIMAVGVCPMVQLAVAVVALHQPHLLQPLQLQNLLLPRVALQNLLRPQQHLSQSHLQLNPNQPPPHKIQHFQYLFLTLEIRS